MTLEHSDDGRAALKWWRIALVTTYTLISLLVVFIVQGEKVRADRNHALRISPTAVEPGLTPPDPLPSNTDFTEVKIGIYLEGIDDLSIKQSNWSPMFYLWFSWKGEKSLDPGNRFRIIGATIEKKELITERNGADGTNYQLYKLKTLNHKFFNTTRVPLDDHMLNIYVEDETRDVSKIRYVADKTANVSSRVKIPGYEITGSQMVVKPHTYKKAHGDPELMDQRTTFSQYNFAVEIRSNGIAIYFKFFIGLFAGVLLTLASFFTPATDGTRFGLPSAAYFGIIGNAYVANSIMPVGNHFGLTDFVTFTGLVTIALCVFGSLISYHYHRQTGGEGLSRQLDKISRKYIGLGFLIINILMPASAIF